MHTSCSSKAARVATEVFTREVLNVSEACEVAKMDCMVCNTCADLCLNWDTVSAGTGELFRSSPWAVGICRSGGVNGEDAATGCMGDSAS